MKYTALRALGAHGVLKTHAMSDVPTAGRGENGRCAKWYFLLYDSC
jgi:hypothetical protein